MRAILPGLQRVLGGMSSRRRASVRRIGMLLVWAALLAVVQTASPADVAQAQDVTDPALNRARLQVSGTLLWSFTTTSLLTRDSTPAVTDFAVTADGSSIAVTGIFQGKRGIGSDPDVARVSRADGARVIHPRHQPDSGPIKE